LTARPWRAVRLVGAGLLLCGVGVNVSGYLAGVRGSASYRPGQDAALVLEMAAIVAGAALLLVGLLPSFRAPAVSRARRGMRISADAALTRRHWALAAMLALMVVIDVMKLDTIGFALPGARREYGLSATVAAAWPVVALAGTVVGAVAWGVLADHAGRRQGLVLAALLFAATAVSATMPSFEWNLVASFAMGLCVGGVLPIVFAMIVETMPTRHRGWLAVLTGGLSTLGGYVVTSLAATLIEPAYGWRPLWLLGVPTGLGLLVLTRWIPESPRFLLARGAACEAERTMARFGMALRPAFPAGEAPAAFGHARRALRWRLAALCVYGMAWGMLNFGFLTWLPTILRTGGLPARSSSALLAVASILGAPAVPLCAYLYVRWHTAHILVVFASATTAALAGMALVGLRQQPAPVLLALPLVALFMSAGGASLVLWVHSSEAFPTTARTTRSGLVAASTRLGGIVGPLLMALTLTVRPGMTAAALVSGGPLALGALLVLRTGSDTRGERPDDEVGAIGDPEPRPDRQGSSVNEI
jgi:MFS transporter, putative metabolite:H+ symporter